MRSILVLVGVLFTLAECQAQSIKFDNPSGLAKKANGYYGLVPNIETIEDEFEANEHGWANQEIGTTINGILASCSYSSVTITSFTSGVSVLAHVEGVCDNVGTTGCEPITIVMALQKQVSATVWTQVDFQNLNGIADNSPACGTVATPNWVFKTDGCEWRDQFGTGNYRMVSYVYPTSALNASPPNWSGWYAQYISPVIEIRVTTPCP